MNVLTELKPKEVFKYFEYLNTVPHGSGNTKMISELCVNFAKEQGLDYYQDEFNNVIIYKKASEGYENHEPVILQGHTDMVYVTSPDCGKNPLTDPITIKTDGEYVWAEKTSLGADDTIAVAMALALLADKNAKHPPIEAVFTVDEETGMTGAKKLDYSKLHGKKMINIDSETEKGITCGCAGGIRVNSKFDVKRSELNDKCLSSVVFCTLTVEGCTGGHSGCEIYKESANANNILFRVLYLLIKRAGIRICTVSGGLFDNAITKKSSALIAVPKNAMEVIKAETERICAMIYEEYKVTDPEFSVSILPSEERVAPICTEDSYKIINAVFSMPFGVVAKSKDIQGLVETSLNLGILSSDENAVYLSHMIRSSIQSKKEYLAEVIKTIVKSNGGTASFGESYPGWSYNRESTLRTLYMEEAKKQGISDVKIDITHAGLECGLFCDGIKGLDCISVGPEMDDIHTVNEKVSVASVERVYNVIKSVLEKL